MNENHEKADRSGRPEGLPAALGRSAAGDPVEAGNVRHHLAHAYRDG